MNNPTKQEQALFHLVFQDTYGSDHVVIVSATDSSQAENKCKRHLENKRITSQLRILSSKEFAQEFKGKKPFYVYYQNCTGKKFCRIFAKDKKEAIKALPKRILGHADPIKALDQQEFKELKTGRVGSAHLSLPPITFTPYLPLSKAVNQ